LSLAEYFSATVLSMLAEAESFSLLSMLG